MDDDQLFDLIAAQRRRIADGLESLTAEQWARPSRCDGWTVQEVAGHLTAGWNISLPRFVLGLVRARGNFNRANARFGQALGARPSAAIVADLRANADHRFTPPGAGPEAPLSDCLVHAHDMFGPAGVDWATDPEITVLVMDRAVAPSTARITGGRVAKEHALRATDVEWSHEQPGRPLRQGPVEQVLLAVFGRIPVEELEPA